MWWESARCELILHGESPIQPGLGVVPRLREDCATPTMATSAIGDNAVS